MFFTNFSDNTYNQDYWHLEMVVSGDHTRLLERVCRILKFFLIDLFDLTALNLLFQGIVPRRTEFEPDLLADVDPEYIRRSLDLSDIEDIITPDKV